MTKPRPTLRTADHLVAAGLQPPELRDDINAVSKRYAVAITPAMAELIDPLNPIDDPLPGRVTGGGVFNCGASPRGAPLPMFLLLGIALYGVRRLRARNGGSDR